MKHLLLRNAFTLKALLLIGLLVSAVSGAWAQSEKITFADLGLENGVQYTNPFDGGDFTVTFAGGANDGKYYNTGTGIRVYGGGTMTIASENYISSITITYDGTNKPTDNVANVGTYDATTGVWTGREKAIVFTRPSGSGHWRVQSIEVTYDTGGTPTCETPVISGETTFMTYTTVSISCATEGAAIKYSTSTDGENYTAYTPYSAPFQISATTQVKAKATKEGLADSKEAYKLFTQQGAIPNIGYFISSHATNPFTNPEYLLLEDALVTFKSGSTAYIKDAYRAVMLYNCASNLEAGDKINGYMKVTGYNPSFNGLPEITGFELVEGYTKTSGNEVTPTVMTLAELLGGGESSPYEMYLSEFIKIENATVTSAFDKKSCTIQQGDYSIILRDQNSTATLTSNVNGIVTVTGHVAIYNDTKQIAVYAQDQIVAGEAPADPTITVTPSSLTGLTYMVEDGPSVAQTISVSGTNLTSDITLTMGDKKFEMSLTEDDGYASSLTLTPSDGAVAATTIYVRLRAGLEVNASYSGSIAIASTGADSKSVALSGSVKEFVPDYASLPFAFDGGKADIESTTGLTQDGLGTDYKSSPFLKFDGTGDALVLKINERPGTLTFDIKGNTFSGGTFTVQTSEDGKTYTDLESYTELGSTQNESFDNLGENVRYIKWIYTNKSNGNVALGNIMLAAYEAPSLGQISISPDTYSMDAKAGGGELPVTCTNLATDPQLAVVFVKEDGVTPQSYDWITAEINDKGNINGQILANTGEARTAYFYVQGVDANNNVVKSNLVTFTQEAPVTEPTITVNTETWEFEYTGGAKTFGFEYDNLGSDPTFSVQFFESDGKTEAECGWITTEFEANDNKVTITAAANDETSARTAYFKIYAEVNKTKVYSNLVTISQKFNSETPQISGDQFVKVNSTEELTEGQYLVVYEEAGLAFDGGLEKLDVAKNTIAVTIADGAIAKTEANSAASFTISAAEGGYTIQGANGKYIGMASDGNGLSESEKEVYTNTISFETNGDANIVGSGGAYLRYNATSGQERFRYYKSSSYTNQKAIALYKLVEEPDTRLDPELSYATTSYEINFGDEFTAPTLTNPYKLTGITYACSNPGVVEVDEETGEISRIRAAGTFTITATFAGDETYKEGSASYTLTVTDKRIATTVSCESIVLDIANIGSLTRLAPVVKDADGNVITYSYDDWPTEMSFEIVADDNYMIGYIDNNTGEMSLNAVAGTVTLKALYNHFNVNSTYQPSECTFTITVVDPDAPGGANNPYSVAEAIEYINTLGSEPSLIDVYVSGIVSTAPTQAPTSNGELTYYISDDGTTTAQLQVFKGKGLDNAAFTAKTDIQEGDEVTVVGKVKLYNKTTYEFDAGNYLVAFNRPAPQKYTLSWNTDDYVTLYVFGENLTEPLSNPAEIAGGTMVTISPDYSVGYEQATLTVVDAMGNVIALTAGEESGTWTFTMPKANVSITATSRATSAITYYALVAEYEGAYFAVNAKGGATWGATEVDAVNGKVVSAQTDALSWDIVSYGKGVGLQNKSTKNYIGWGSTSTDLASSTTIVQWTIDSENNTWTNMKGASSGTVRTLLYNGSGFKNYAASNVNTPENPTNYSGYTTAYTFSDGYVRDLTRKEGGVVEWGTICLTNTVAADDYSGVTFYNIKGKTVDTNGNPVSLVLEEETGELTAGVAYIFQTNEGATKLIAAYSDETIDEPFSAADNKGLEGSFTGTAVKAGMYLLSGGKIVQCGEGCSIGPNRAFINMDDVPNVTESESGVKLFIGGEDGVSSLDAATEGAVIYDLSGRRVSKTAKGLYIINGKKVSVK